MRPSRARGALSEALSRARPRMESAAPLASAGIEALHGPRLRPREPSLPRPPWPWASCSTRGGAPLVRATESGTHGWPPTPIRTWTAAPLVRATAPRAVHQRLALHPGAANSAEFDGRCRRPTHQAAPRVTCLRGPRLCRPRVSCPSLSLALHESPAPARVASRARAPRTALDTTSARGGAVCRLSPTSPRRLSAVLGGTSPAAPTRRIPPAVLTIECKLRA